MLLIEMIAAKHANTLCRQNAESVQKLTHLQ